MNIFSRILILPILAYRYIISPLIPPRCRYQPTCSDYAIEALKLHGPVHGAGLAFKRLLRCHPWSGYGYDPVPPLGQQIDKSGAGKKNSGCSCGGDVEIKSPLSNQKVTNL
jgi:putative membrane protein insertion efficiency factor